jgi:hypothetical protein
MLLTTVIVNYSVIIVSQLLLETKETFKEIQNSLAGAYV